MLNLYLASFLYKVETLNFTDYYDFNSAAIFTIIAIPVFWFFGIYRTIFRYTGLSILSTISLSCIWIFIGIIGIKI